MSREYKTELTITCDRCGCKSTFITEQEAEESLKWKTLSTDTLGFTLEDKTFDLCPMCFELFETEFIKWFPGAFKDAFKDE